MVARPRHAAKCSCSPHRFALYMARSAARKIASGSSPSRGNTATPKLARSPLRNACSEPGRPRCARPPIARSPRRSPAAAARTRRRRSGTRGRSGGWRGQAGCRTAPARHRRLMPVPVVQLLEAVQVAQHQRERPVVAAGAGGFVGQPARERAAVEQMRQRVVLGQVAHLFEVVRCVDRGRRLVGEHAQRLQHVSAGDQPVLGIVHPDDARQLAVSSGQRHQQPVAVPGQRPGTVALGCVHLGGRASRRSASRGRAGSSPPG